MPGTAGGIWQIRRLIPFFNNPSPLKSVPISWRLSLAASRGLRTGPRESRDVFILETICEWRETGPSNALSLNEEA